MTLPLGSAGPRGDFGATEIVGQCLSLLRSSGIDARAWALAWARVAPAVAIVPAFGLRALPFAARATVALLIAVLLVPAIEEAPASSSSLSSSFSLPIELVIEIARGLPVALAAAVPLWAATMAGGLIDTLRGAQDNIESPVVEGRTGAIGLLFALLAAALFLRTGGPAHVATALLDPPPLSLGPFVRASANLVSGINVAVAIGAPILAAAIVVEVAIALLARAASPAQVHTTLAGAKSLVLLSLVGIFFQKVAEVIEAYVVHGVP